MMDPNELRQNIRIVQPTWDDIRFPASADKLYSPAGRITFDYGAGGVGVPDGGISYAVNARWNNEWTFYICQMLHKYTLGSQVSPHIHWVQTSANVPHWVLEYRCHDLGEDPTIAWTGPVAYTTHDFTYVAGNIQQATHFTHFDPVFVRVSGIIEFKLYRDSANASGLFGGADPLAAAAILKEFDVHHESDALGSMSETDKWS